LVFDDEGFASAKHTFLPFGIAGVGAPGAKLPDQRRLGTTCRGGRAGSGSQALRLSALPPAQARAWAIPWPHPWRPLGQHLGHAQRMSPAQRRNGNQKCQYSQHGQLVPSSL
jgi:hypothetical protein